jgi:hypothetical protein
MRGAVSIIYMARDGEYQVPIFNIDQPDPDAVKRREERVAELRERMGEKYILHPGYVKPAANQDKLL